MTRFFIYIFAALIVGQALSIEYFSFLDVDEVQEMLEDLSEENDSSEEENELEDHFDKYASFWKLDKYNSGSTLNMTLSSNAFLELVFLEIPSPPPDMA